MLVSLGQAGMFAKHHSQYYRVKIPKISVVNPVGSGDATIAGFVHALLKTRDPETMLKTANTLGMLNAQEAVTGLVNVKHFDSLYRQIQVRPIEKERKEDLK